MNATEAEASAIRDRACEWLVLLEEDSGAGMRARFEAWLDEDPAHREACREAQAVLGALRGSSVLCALAAEVDRELALESGRNSTPARGVLANMAAPALAAGLALAILAGAVLTSRMADGPVYATRTAQTSAVSLADGSTVELAPESRIKVSYSAAARRVSLAGGEAFFSVAKGDPRPFIVMAGDAEVRVAGTRFNVHRGPAGVTVAVEEGQVDVSRRQGRAILAPFAASAPAPQRQPLAAGELVVAGKESGVAAPVDIDPGRAGVWRSGLLIYRDNTLREVIADVNRYSRREIVLASGDLNDMRLMAAFQTSNIDEMLDGLEDLLPVTVDRSAGDRIVIRPRPPA